MYRKPGQWKAYVALTWYSFRAQTRNPATFFFGFIFPVVFISIFGLIGNTTPKINIGITNNSDMNNPIVQAVAKQQYFIVHTSSMENLNHELTQGKIAGILEVKKESNEHFAVNTYLSSGFPQEAASINAFVQSTVDKSNLNIAGVIDPAIKYQQKEMEGRKPRYIDFALPGQIGFSLLSTAIFGTVFGLIYLKKALILKRMFATPTKAMTILLAQGTSRLIVALAQTVLILVLGVVVFQFYLPHGIITFVELLILSAFGLVAFLGFGYLIAGLSSDENAASPLTNLVTLPQFLLSGTFFSTDFLPAWIQPIANNLPLSYFNIAVRKITTEGGTIVETWPYLLGLAIWGAVMYILAARTFKWQ
jgi:ABC-2 type transport system permease protein